MRTPLLTLLLIILSASLYSQTIPEPDFSSRPYFLLENGSLKSFERSAATVDIKLKGIYRGSESYLTVFDSESATKLNLNNLPRILIKLEGNADPYEVVSVVKAELQKDRRRFLQRDQALGGKARDISDVNVSLEFQKIRDGLWEVILPESLTNGEYAFMPLVQLNENLSISGQTYISCFSIYGGIDNNTSASQSENSIATKNINNSSNIGTSKSIYNKPNPSFGVRAGFGASRTTYWAQQFTPSFLFGALLEFPVYQDYLSIQTGANFQKFGGIDVIENDALHTYYLRLPVMLKGGYRFNNDMKIYAGVGPNFGIGLAGKEKNAGEVYPAFTRNSIYGIKPNKRFDLGISFEIGYEINRKMIVSINTINGIFNISNFQSVIEKNRGFNFSFTYKLGNVGGNKSQVSNNSNQIEINSNSISYPEKIESTPALQTCQVCQGKGTSLTEFNVVCSAKCNKGIVECTVCNGTRNGKSLGNKFNPITKKIEPVYEKCSSCEGAGETTCKICNGKGIELKSSQQTCPNCLGTGKK